MSLLGGSWAVVNGVRSRVTIHISGLITPLITTHEPPSKGPCTHIVYTWTLKESLFR